MSLRKKKSRPSYAQKVLRETVSTRPEFARAVDGYNGRARARKAGVLAQARQAAKGEKIDYAKLEKEADRLSGSKDTLANTSPAAWEEMIEAVCEVPAGLAKADALEDFDSTEPKRKWKSNRRLAKRKRKSLSPMLKRLVR